MISHSPARCPLPKRVHKPFTERLNVVPNRDTMLTMPFIRTKTIKGIEYNYLVEATRVDGKPRQRVMAYLGRYKTVRGALAYWEKRVKAGPDAAARKHAREMVSKLKPYR